MTEQEAIDLLRFAFPKEITKPVTEEVISKAVKALEKQIPKEPSQLIKHTDYFHWECPECNMSYGMATQKAKYCYNCGQAIKWE